MELRVDPPEPAATVTPPMFQLMDTDRNSWQYEQAGSYVTDTGGDEELLLSPTSLPNFDWQPLKGDSWQLPVDPDISLLQSFVVVGDGDVETAPGPENLVMCSRETQGLLPKRNHTTVARIAQNLNHRRSQKNDGVKKTGSRHRTRGPNWTLAENRSFLQRMEVEVQKDTPPWEAISEDLKGMGFVRKAKACEDHWGVLLADVTKIEKYFGSDNILRDRHFWPSVGTMSREQRSQNGLPLVFEEEWFEVIARIVEDRSRKRRKPRRESFKGRIHVAGTPASSSGHRQSRVCAASATPSSEIFDILVGDGDGMSKLVKLLGSTDRNVTVEQTIEVMRMSLEAQRMDLRRREIEWEREQWYQGQRNELPEKARPPPAADEWI